MSEFELNGKTLVVGGSRSGKYNPFNPDLVKKILNKEEIRTTICNFYKKEHAHISQFTNDKKYRELIFKLILLVFKREGFLFSFYRYRREDSILNEVGWR